MRVMNSQYETSGKIHIYSFDSKSRTQNIIYPPEKTIFGTSSILARGKSRVLPTSPLFTLCQMVRAFWRDHGSFGACCKCPLNYNICALLYIDRGYTQYQRQVNIFLSLLFPDHAIQCLHNKSSSHGVPNTNLSNFTCLVDFGKVLSSSTNELQQNSNASSRED